jgi:hypothetical protein
MKRGLRWKADAEEALLVGLCRESARLAMNSCISSGDRYVRNTALTGGARSLRVFRPSVCRVLDENLARYSANEPSSEIQWRGAMAVA